ncbi:MAG: hypothetical protein MRY63_00595 [Neomegalonema sp.]|nr:hypothetical protein [Neomegalonema sp.]
MNWTVRRARAIWSRLWIAWQRITGGASRAFRVVRFYVWLVLVLLVASHGAMQMRYRSTDPCQILSHASEDKVREARLAAGIQKVGLATVMEDGIFYRMEQQARAGSIFKCYGAVIDLATDGDLDRDWFGQIAPQPPQTVPETLEPEADVSDASEPGQ